MKNISTRTKYDSTFFTHNLHNSKMPTNGIDFINNKDLMWDVASDEAHTGIHWQYHVAENFIKRMK